MEAALSHGAIPTTWFIKRRECDVSLGTAVLLLVLRYCYCDSSTLVHAGHPRSLSVWSSCVIACVAHIAVPDRQRIDFCGTHIAKAKLQYSGCAALMLFQVNSCPSWGHLQATSGQTHGYLTSSLCWTFVFLWQTQFSRCAQTHFCSIAPSGGSK